jgi:hypothetical protein
MNAIYHPKAKSKPISGFDMKRIASVKKARKLRNKDAKSHLDGHQTSSLDQ